MCINALTRTGHTPFPLSHRNTAVGMAHLLSESKMTALYTSADPLVQGLVNGALEVLESKGLATPTIFPVPSFDQFQEGLESANLLPPMKTPEWSSTAVILQSSGSTSEFCKLIRMSFSRVIGRYLQLIPIYKSSFT